MDSLTLNSEPCLDAARVTCAFSVCGKAPHSLFELGDTRWHASAALRDVLSSENHKKSTENVKNTAPDRPWEEQVFTETEPDKQVAPSSMSQKVLGDSDCAQLCGTAQCMGVGFKVMTESVTSEDGRVRWCRRQEVTAVRGDTLVEAT